MKNILTAGLFLIWGFTLHSQSAFTLEQCVEYAWTNNPDVRQAILNHKTSEIDKMQSRTMLLPTVSANAGQNYQFGRTIDRFSNQFTEQTIRSNNFGLSTNLLLFNGLQNQSAIRQSNELEKAALENIETIRNQVALNVANAFLLTIQAVENIRNAEFQIESTKQRIERAQKMVDAGTADLSALLSLKAQKTNEELNLVTAKNSRDAAMLNLKTLMLMPPTQELELIIPDINPELFTNALSTEELYAIAVQNMPQIKAAEHQTEASRFQRDFTRGGISPTIVLYGSLNTVFSENAKEVRDIRPTGTQVIGYTQNGNDNVLQPVFDYSLSTIPFSRQLKDNRGQSAGITLSWNLFNGMQVRNQISKARINMEVSELNLIRTKNTLLNEVGTAMNGYQAAKARYDAARNNTEAQKLSFEYMEKRYDAGASTSFDFIQAKNSYLQAQAAEVQARYELVFRALILEFYKGNPIKL